MRKKETFFFSPFTLFLIVYPHNFLLLSIFFSSLLLALTHAILLDYTVLVLSLSLSNGRMTYPFISSYFSFFLPSALFTSSHNKCKPLTLNFVHNKDDFNSSFWQTSPASSLHFADFSALLSNKLI